MVKRIICITGKLEDDDLPWKDIKKDLEIKAANLKLEDLKIFDWGSARLKTRSNL
jgi:hypothetical protein